MSVGIEDRYNRGNTYQYWAVGELYQNQIRMQDLRARLYVPPGLPDREGPPAEDLWYDDPKTSPVTWVVLVRGRTTMPGSHSRSDTGPCRGAAGIGRPLPRA